MRYLSRTPVLLFALVLGALAGPIGLLSLKPATSGGGGGSPPSGGATQLLEDFTLSPRNNGEGDMLFDAYTGEDPGSSAAIVSGRLQLTGSMTTGRSIYMDFLPIV